ncbi:hypothetical protein [Paenisporosarcina sp. NPDC076898]|uniref:hypothetical protein n=1 Tax=unclassified Paenisporosarcina TaxID=2642018 RepID=UPI003D02B2AA
MKKIVYLFIACLFFYSTSTSALSWAYSFVVHNGKVYEVKEGIPITQSELGDMIGKVETKADEHSGKYFGNASNYYKIGTRYFEIKEVSTSEAIAVESKPNNFIKAEYVHEAPFHITDILYSGYSWILIGVGVLLLGFVVLRSRQL